MLDERLLAQGLREGKAEAWQTLYDAFAGQVWRAVARLLGARGADVGDVVQETMLRAWRHPAVLDQTDGSARGWLFTVARRIVIDDWRATRHQRELVTADLPENPVSDGTDDRVNSAVLTAALRRLSTEHRQVLLECYYRGSSVAQAAARLGIPVGTVKSRTHYALHALRLALDEMGGVG